MIGPNLSEWALAKRSLVVFLMIVAVVAGTFSFMNLGRGEDPAFTFRTMVVAAAWPGATVDETLNQVTERIERKLQETDYLERVRSYTTAGQTTIFVDLKQSTPPHKVPDIWYQVRKNIGDIRGTLPGGVIGPGFNDDFGSTFGIIYAFTADGFSFRELRDHVEAARSRLLHVPDVSEIEVLGAQDEQIYIEFSTERLAGLRLDYPTILASLQAQNLVRPAGTIQTEQERVFLRVSGSFDSELDIESVNIVAGDRMFRLGDIATVRRGFSDPPQPMFRVNGQRAIGLAIAMRDAGDILALGRNVRSEMADITANLPHGIEPTLVADQAVSVDVAINDFMTSLWQAIVIILVCSFLSLGGRPGAVVALAIPLTLAVVFAVMDIANIDLHRISLGALIIALGLLVDDAMTTVDAMLRRLGAGDSMDEAATFSYRTLAAPMLIGALVTIASFVPIGFARSNAGEYTFDIFSVVAISLVASWLVAVVFAPLLGKAILKAPKVGGAQAKQDGRRLSAVPALRDPRQMADHRPDAGRFRRRHLPVALRAAAVLSGLRPERADRSSMTLRQNASIYATEARGPAPRGVPEGRSRRRPLQHLCRPRRDPLHPDPRRAAGQPVLRPVRDRRQGLRRARAAARRSWKKCSPSSFPTSSRASRRSSSGRRWAGRCSTGSPARQGRGAPNRARTGAGAGGRHAAHGTSTTTGWSRPGRCASASTRTRRGARHQLAALATVLNAAVTGTTVTQVRDDIYLVNVVAARSTSERASFGTLWLRCRCRRRAGAWCR
jgi:multidrug efflux pump subunit AcrB